MVSSTAETRAPRRRARRATSSACSSRRGASSSPWSSHVRPELLRYCARMTGSIADGEDVVQETLARACYELPQLKELPLLRPWLFRIAHNRAIDHWRHESLPRERAARCRARRRRRGRARARPRRRAPAGGARRDLVFLELAPAQRGCVILKDVLEHSIDEIAVELGLSVAAVKAALHRGRAALQRGRTPRRCRRRARRRCRRR